MISRTSSEVRSFLGEYMSGLSNKNVDSNCFFRRWWRLNPELRMPSIALLGYLEPPVKFQSGSLVESKGGLVLRLPETGFNWCTEYGYGNLGLSIRRSLVRTVIYLDYNVRPLEMGDYW